MSCKYPHCPGGEYGFTCESECRPNRSNQEQQNKEREEPEINLDMVLLTIVAALIWIMLIVPIGS